MTRLGYLKAALIGGASAIAFATAAHADQFNIPSGDLKTALDVYTTQTGVELVVAGEAVRGVRTHGARGELTATAALSRILAGTGFVMQRDESGAVGIVRAPKDAPQSERIADATPTHMAAPLRASKLSLSPLPRSKATSRRFRSRSRRCRRSSSRRGKSRAVPIL